MSDYATQLERDLKIARKAGLLPAGLNGHPHTVTPGPPPGTVGLAPEEDANYTPPEPEYDPGWRDKTTGAGPGGGSTGEQEAEERPGKLRLIPSSRFRAEEPPPREWFVEGLIPMNTVTLLSGDGGTGKSLLSLQLAAHRGKWLGREVRPGKTVFITAEDDEDELHRRVFSITGGAEDGGEDHLSLASLAGECALLATVEKDGVLIPSPLFMELERMVARKKPVLLVLDTAADLYPGNENDRAQVRQFIGMLRGLAIRHRLAIVLLYHPSVRGMADGSGASGSTAWNNSCRSRLYLERIVERSEGAAFEPDPDARKLKVMKANYGRTGEEIPMRWEDGVFVPVDDGQATGSESREAREARAEDVFLRLLRRHLAENRPVNANTGNNYAPTVFARDPDRAGLRRDDFRGAMDRLLRGKRIHNEAYGPPSKQRTRLAPIC